MDAEASFRHAPLGDPTCEIRLVKIQSELDPDGRICLDLTSALLLRTSDHENSACKTPEYTALSYMWGDRTNDESICLSCGSLSVSYNLHKCLQALRGNGDSDKWLWIDQLCIDQSNTKERNQQVRMMGDIYRKASLVIIWLGPSTVASDSAISALQSPDRSPSEEQRSQVEELLTRPYWRRLWIIQEVILAQYLTIMCGSKQLSWTRFAERLYPKTVWWMDDTDPLATIMRIRHDYKRPPTLYEAICFFEENQCKDPRDMVYGLLGFTTGFKIENEIAIDYSKSVAEVYADVLWMLSRWILEHDKSGKDRLITSMTNLGSRMGLFSPAQKDLMFVHLSLRGLYYNRERIRGLVMHVMESNSSA